MHFLVVFTPPIYFVNKSKENKLLTLASENNFKKEKKRNSFIILKSCFTK